MTTDAPPDERRALLDAIEQFNTWRFYDCHETLEDVWLETGGKSNGTQLTAFYHGIIKAAAGFHHVLRDNHKGATLLLTDSIRLLGPYAPRTLTVEVQLLVEALRTCLDRLIHLGPDHIAEFDRSTIPQITYDADALSD